MQPASARRRASRSAPSRRPRCSSPAAAAAADRLAPRRRRAGRAAAAASAAAQPDRRQAGHGRPIGATVVGVLTRRAAAIAGARGSAQVRIDNRDEATRRDDHQRRVGRISLRAGRELLDALRDRLGLTGTKEGCATGDCGACSVLSNGRLVPSCLVLAAEAQGRSITTIEGVARGGRPASRCSRSFSSTPRCSAASARPGFIVAAKALLDRESRPDGAAGRATGWPATCAAAPATTRSSAPCSTRPDEMQKGSPL